MEKHWTTAAGEKIPISDLKTDHLQNIVSMIERKADEGLVVFRGGGWPGEADSYWGDEEILFGDNVRRKFPYKQLIIELGKRLDTTKPTGGEDE